MAKELGSLWKVVYKQRFGKSPSFDEYTDTFVGPDDLAAAVQKFKTVAMAQQSIDDSLCTGLQILSFNCLATLTMKV